MESGMDLRQGAGGTLELLITGPVAEVTGGVWNEKGEPAPGAKYRPR